MDVKSDISSLYLVHIGQSFFKNKTEEALEVLRDINLRVRGGGFVSLVGPNGCGKTTLLRITAGLLKPTQGKIILGDVEINEPGQGIGMMFQESGLLPWRTAWKNIELGMVKKSSCKAEKDQAIRNYISRFGLEGFEQCFPKELSGGMKQKVAIARALVNEPQALLMDEPFASLDAQSRNFLQEFLVHMWQKDSKTIIFVTHNVDEAIFLGERVIVIGRRPAQVKLDLKIDLPHPRDRTCSRFNRIRKDILESLKKETFFDCSRLKYFSEGS